MFIMITLLQQFFLAVEIDNFQMKNCDNFLIFAKNIDFEYHKVPKFSDARKLCCNLPKIQTKKPNLRLFCQKDVNGIANSVDPDQTAPKEQSDLGLHCLPRPICPKTYDHYGYSFSYMKVGLKVI